MSLVVPATLRRSGRTETLTIPLHTNDDTRTTRGNPQTNGQKAKEQRMRNQQLQTSGADVDTRARWIASQIRTHRGCRRNLRIFDGDTGDNGDTAPTLSFSAFTAWGHVGTNGDKSIKRF